MSDELSKEAGGKKVSPARKAVSGLILVALLVVLGIELRAGAGQIMTANALQAVAKDGAFPPGTLSRADVEGMLKLSPAEEEVRDGNSEVEVRYTWKSLLRPLFNRPEAELFVTYGKSDPQIALRHGTEAPGNNEIESLPFTPGPSDPDSVQMPGPPGFSESMDGGGGHDAEGDGGNSAGDNGSERRRPPSDE